DGSLWGIQEYMGPIPAMRDQWIQLVVSTSPSDLWISYYWAGIGYGLAGGRAEWDLTTTLSDASLTIAGLNMLCNNCNNGIRVSIYDATNGAVVATANQNGGDTAALNLYKPSSRYSWTA